MDSRICCDCETRKPIKEFNQGQYLCKVCQRAYSKKYKRKRRNDKLQKIRDYKKELELGNGEFGIYC